MRKYVKPSENLMKEERTMTKLTGKYMILHSLIVEYGYHKYMAGAYCDKPEGLEHDDRVHELARIIDSMLERRSENNEETR